MDWPEGEWKARPVVVPHVYVVPFITGESDERGCEAKMGAGVEGTEQATRKIQLLGTQ